MAEKFDIKLATIDDMKAVFELSNDMSVRQNSFNSDKIDWDLHKTWFENKIKNENYLFFVIKTEQNQLISQVRFDKTDNTISISIAENYRGQGYGTKILKQVSDKILNEYKVKKINAYVKIENIISQRIFEKSGYNLKEKLKDKIRLEYNG